MPPLIHDISQNRNPETFYATLTLTSRGDWIIYHRGIHAAGAHKADALDAANAGLVNLAQRRVEGTNPAEFEYIAQRTSKKWRK